MKQTPYPAANLRMVRRLEREYRAACTHEERADDLATAQRLALASDRVARRLAAARDGLTIEAPRTRRNLARVAFAALATIGAVIARAVRRAESLRRASLAAAVKRAAIKVARAARASLRRAVRAVAVAVASSPALALAHPGHPEHDMPAGVAVGALVVTAAVLAAAASKAWDTIGPRRRALASITADDGPPPGGDDADDATGARVVNVDKHAPPTKYDAPDRVVLVGDGDPGDECEHTDEHGQPCHRRPRQWSIPDGSGYVVACDAHADDLVQGAYLDGSIYTLPER